MVSINPWQHDIMSCFVSHCDDLFSIVKEKIILAFHNHIDSTAAKLQPVRVLMERGELQKAAVDGVI